MVSKRLAATAYAALVVLATLFVFVSPHSAHASDFTDVDGHWAEESGVIDEVVDRGLIKGISNGDGTMSFQPNAKITRAQVAVILWRYFEPDADDGEYDRNHTSWTDVKSRMWYTNAMNWAYSNEIYKGSNGMVRPNDPITREELAVLLNRCSQRCPFYDPGVSGDVDDYIDGGKVLKWALSSVAWAVDHEIMGSTAYLNPLGNATRAEASKMILRFVETREVLCPAPGEQMCFIFCESDPSVEGWEYFFNLAIPYHPSLEVKGTGTSMPSASYDYDFDGEIDDYYIVTTLGCETSLGKTGSLYSEKASEVRQAEGYLLGMVKEFADLFHPADEVYREYVFIENSRYTYGLEGAFVQTPYEDGWMLETALVTTQCGDFLVYHVYESGLPVESMGHYLAEIMYGGDYYPGFVEPAWGVDF